MLHAVKTMHRRPWLGVVISVVLAVVIYCSGDWVESALRPRSSLPATPENVWAAVQRESRAHGLDPAFVYAIVMAESSLRPHADSGYARGIMQLSRVAWNEVSDRPYREAWNWEKNIAVGVAYLAWCKTFLEKSNRFNYPRLAACYRYGPYRVRAERYDLNRLPQPNNRIYRELFAGNLRPVQPPG